MKQPARDDLLDRILAACKLSAGRMPVELVVRDDAERARGLALLKGRHNNAAIGFVTEAELCERGRRQLGAWARRWRRGEALAE